MDAQKCYSDALLDRDAGSEIDDLIFEAPEICHAAIHMDAQSPITRMCPAR